MYMHMYAWHIYFLQNLSLCNVDDDLNNELIQIKYEVSPIQGIFGRSFWKSDDSSNQVGPTCSLEVMKFK